MVVYYIQDEYQRDLRKHLMLKPVCQRFQKCPGLGVLSIIVIIRFPAQTIHDNFMIGSADDINIDQHTLEACDWLKSTCGPHLIIEDSDLQQQQESISIFWMQGVESTTIRQVAPPQKYIEPPKRAQ